MKLNDSNGRLQVQPVAIARPNAFVWIGATVIGYALGLALATYLAGAVARPLSPVLGGLLFVAVYGGVLGIAVGAAQLAAFPRGAAAWHIWLPATVLGALVGCVLAAVAGEWLGNAIDPGTNIILGGGIIQQGSGALLGLAIGTAQAITLRRMLPGVRGWILATLLGCALGYGAAAAMLEILEVPLLRINPVLSFGAILGIFTGGLHALALRSAR